MGFIDAIRAEDRVEVTFSQFHALVKESVTLDMVKNGLKNNVPSYYIMDMLDMPKEVKSE